MNMSTWLDQQAITNFVLLGPVHSKGHLGEGSKIKIQIELRNMHRHPCMHNTRVLLANISQWMTSRYSSYERSKCFWLSSSIFIVQLFELYLFNMLQHELQIHLSPLASHIDKCAPLPSLLANKESWYSTIPSSIH